MARSPEFINKINALRTTKRRAKQKLDKLHASLDTILSDIDSFGDALQSSTSDREKSEIGMKLRHCIQERDNLVDEIYSLYKKIFDIQSTILDLYKRDNEL